jgi:hypothetical protein
MLLDTGHTPRGNLGGIRKEKETKNLNVDDVLNV